MLHLDLIPLELHRRRRVFGVLRLWFLGLAAAVVLFTSVYGYEKDRLEIVVDAVNRREARYKPVLKKQNEIRNIQKQLDSLRSHEAIAFTLEDRHPALTLVATVGNAAGNTDGKLNIDSLSFDRTKDERHLVTLNGQVTDHLGMAKFLSALRDSNLFQSVDPKWMKARDNGKWTVQQFEVECVF